MSTRVLIVDDEIVARRRIRRLLAAEADVTIVGECADGRSALDAIAAHHPDIVFLDVQMPELDGFDLVQALSAPPAIVFVTAFDRYALKAFDVHAIDYLLKPFSAERFRTALARARTRARDASQAGALSALVEQLRARHRYPVRVAVPTGDRIVVVDWADVDWIEAADNYVKLHVGAKEYLLRDTVAALEKTLDPDRFTRVHRSVIVQIDRIAELHPESHGDFTLRLRSGTQLSLSRTFSKKVVSAFGRT